MRCLMKLPTAAGCPIRVRFCGFRAGSYASASSGENCGLVSCAIENGPSGLGEAVLLLRVMASRHLPVLLPAVGNAMTI